VGDDPIIAESARKHGVSDEDILQAYANPIRVFHLDEGFTMVIGANLGHHLRDRCRRRCLGSGHRPRDESTREVSEVMRMPRTIKDILDHADELAKRFVDYEPSATDERDPAVFAELRRAVLSRSDAERSIRDAVKHARERGYSWAFIGSLVGTSGEAARQRYGHRQDA
jgi:hypothetical protein